jgi:hypothetical protein
MTQNREAKLQRDRERQKLRRPLIRAQNRINLLDYFLTHPYVDCGESDPVVLEFDHLRDKSYNVSALLRAWSWNRVLQEIEKCEVVCANCHKRRTAKQFGWWKQ